MPAPSKAIGSFAELLGAKSSAFKYPQQAALEQASKNAETMLGLPPGNTAMDRAKAMGFEGGWAHGTTADIKRFSPEFRGDATGAESAKKAYFLASDPVAPPANMLTKAPANSEFVAMLKGLGIPDEEIAKLNQVSMKGHGAETASGYAQLGGSREYKEAMRKANAAEKKGNWSEYEKWMQVAEDAEIGRSNELQSLVAKYGDARDVMLDSINKSILSKVRPQAEQELLDAKMKQLMPYGWYNSYSIPQLKALKSEIAKLSDAPESALKSLDDFISVKAERQLAENTEQGGNVMPLMLRSKNPMTHDFGGSAYREQTYSDLVDQAARGGSDVLFLRNTFDPGAGPAKLVDVAAVRDPSLIRSRFAAFDPARIKENDLLAGAIPLSFSDLFSATPAPATPAPVAAEAAIARPLAAPTVPAITPPTPQVTTAPAQAASTDSISERQRTSPIIGKFADLFAAASSPKRTQQAQGIAKALEFPAIAETLDRLSYGEPLTTGKGMTTKMRPETELSFMALLGLAPTGKPAQAGAMAAGRAGEQLAERVVPNVMARGGLPAEMLNALATQTQSRALPPAGRSGFGVFDPRFDPRVKEQARLQAMTRNVELNPGVQPAPTVSLVDFEGRPFITSMSDRTAAGGKLIGIDDVAFNRPVELIGGQDYMFYNPGQVWASGQGPTKQLIKQAAEIKQITGQNPIYMPWRMAPTGGDFSTMTGETMLAYADAAMNKNQKRSLDKQIRQFIPDWSGVSDSASVEQFRSASDKQRKAIKNMMDTQFREKGGLNIGGARLSVSDPLQLNAQEGGLMNVGEIFAGQPMIMRSGHPDYPRAVPGRGIGTLKEDLNVFQLLPEVVRARRIQNPTAPAQADLRALQMKPYSGIITNELLKSLGY